MDLFTGSLFSSIDPYECHLCHIVLNTIALFGLAKMLQKNPNELFGEPSILLENSAVATGLKKVSFHSNPKERQCQIMLKLPPNCTHLTHQQSNAQNPPSQALTVCEL